MNYKNYEYRSNTYSTRVKWDRALFIKSLLNARGYLDYNSDPLLGFYFMRDGFADFANGFDSGNRVFMVENLGSSFYEKNSEGLESFGKFYDTQTKGLSDMVHIINTGNGFCVVTLKEVEPSIMDLEKRNLIMRFYDGNTFNYIHSLPNGVFGRKIVRVNGLITWDSMADLFEKNYSDLQHYISPDFEKKYLDASEMPSTEPGLTMLLEGCYCDVARFYSSNVAYRRKKK